VVGQQYLDFGEVWEDPAFAWVIPIENRSAETIRIVEFVPTCSCTAVKPSQEPRKNNLSNYLLGRIV
jgi:hypothetical protein